MAAVDRPRRELAGRWTRMDVRHSRHRDRSLGLALCARYYMSPEDPLARFFAFFLAFMGSMLGLVTAGNLIQLVVFWELTSLMSFLLIGYWHHRRDAQQGARMALTVTGAGGLALLGGVMLLGHIVGSYDLDAVLSAGERVRAHPLYPTTLVLILLGALTKSAHFPFTSGFRERWRRRRRSPPTCTQPRWSKRECSC